MSNKPGRSLAKTAPTHPFLVELAEKSDLFDKAASKYSPKVSA
jgi:coatomer subunit epsilon